MEHKLKGRAAADEEAFLKHLGAFQNDDHREFSTRSVLGEDIAFLLNDGGDGGEGSEGGGGGIAFETLVAAERRAASMAVPVAKVLADFGIVTQEAYFRRVGAELGLEYVHQTPVNVQASAELPAPKDFERMARMVAVGPIGEFDVPGLSKPIIYVAPDGQLFSALKKLLSRSPHLHSRFRVSTLSSNMSSLAERNRQTLTKNAVEGLFSSHWQLSARFVMTPRQAVIMLIALESVLVVWIMSNYSMSISLHVVASTFYSGCIALRLYACFILVFKQKLRTPEQAIPTVSDARLPVYSILVALYHEENQVKHLVHALAHLDWPRERLEIKLICEEDDTDTVQACKRAIAPFGGSLFSIVSVPESYPRTKPKALNYALPLCQGQLVVVYDAEDRPHPMQLREAYSAFCAGPSSLACLQAPLCIHNHEDGWLARLFAIEYSALYHGLFPALANARLPVPLGGTSNHLKRSVLDRIGGWDPFNVTEDADLGIRLARAGCVVGSISSPTYEEAPVTFIVWLRQRSRWFKGWYQTWLVHMRHPVKLTRDLGPFGCLVFQLMIFGMAVSALVHPALLYHVLVSLVDPVGHRETIIQQWLFWLDLLVVSMGYMALVTLAWCTLPFNRLQNLRSALWTVPLYWMLLSVAAWRALWLLVRRPHEWEKTPHTRQRVESNEIAGGATRSDEPEDR